jgi:hypothetical protein
MMRGPYGSTLAAPLVKILVFLLDGLFDVVDEFFEVFLLIFC